MSTATAANVKKSESSHWYYVDGRPCYELPKKDGSGMKATTLADARKLNLLPSVTTILRILDKPALTAWKIEQAVLACITSPQKEGESQDEFVHRILNVEEVQLEEAKAAADKGNQIHAALEALAKGVHPEPDMVPFVIPPWEKLMNLGRVLASEVILIGPGYAGKTDLLMEGGGHEFLIDYKSTKKLPDPKKGGAWKEHRLQLAAYARARAIANNKLPGVPMPIHTINLYISSVNPGEFVLIENPPWENDYVKGFAPLVDHWQWERGYYPNQF